MTVAQSGTPCRPSRTPPAGLATQAELNGAEGVAVDSQRDLCELVRRGDLAVSDISAHRRYRRMGGQGRGRTADLPIFSRTLVPTELPGRKGVLVDTLAATPTGLEPATFAVTGRRANQLRHGASAVPCPQRDSNPRYRLERAAS